MKRAWSHAFATDSPEAELGAEDRVLVERVATLVVERGMAVPAVLLLESFRPLSFVGSQVMHFLEPFATLALNRDQYDRFARLLENRAGVDLLLDAIGKEQESKHE